MGSRGACRLAARSPAPVVSVVVIFAIITACRRVDKPGVVPSTQPSPSVLLVTLDTTRADRLGCYGFPDASTPNLDALAARGARFTSARASAPITLPSHVSILTGLYPMTSGVHDNGIATLADSASTLSEQLTERGLTCGAFVAAFVLDARFGLDQGFARYDDVDRVDRQGNHGLIDERPASEVVDAALAWVDETPSPFFAWVHLFDAHHPYAPPEPYASRFPADPYQGEIAYADEQLGRLLDGLTAKVGDDLLVVVTADHGEGLMEHGEATHTTFIYDTTIRVPLIVAGPGIESGLVIDDAVATVDIAPTVVALAGAKSLVDIDGVSLVPLLHGGTIERDRPIFIESYWGFLNHGWSPLLGAFDGRRKFIEAPRPELYDLDEDPHEVTNLHASDLQDPRMSRGVRAFWNGRSTQAEERSVSPQERRVLDQMGYVGGASGGRDLPFPSRDGIDPKDRIRTVDRMNEILALLTRFDRDGGRDRALLDRIVAETNVGLEESPESATLHEFAGLALAKKGDHSAAIPHLRRCVAMRHDNTDARFALAYSLVESGDVDAGVVELKQCLVAEPNFAKGAWFLAVIHERRGDVDAAISYWRQFLDHHPSDDREAQVARENLLRLKDRKESSR